MPRLAITGTMRLVGSFLAGVILYHTVGRSFPWAGEAAALFVLLFLVSWSLALKRPLARRRRIAGLAALLAVAAVAFWGSFLKNRPETLPVNPQHITHYKITLVKAVAVKPTSVSSVGRIEAVRVNGHWLRAQGRVAVFFPRSAKADALKYGRQLLVKGNLAPPAAAANPFQFDYRRYLAQQHIQWQSFLYESAWLPLGNDPPSYVVAVSLLVRNKLEAAFKTHISARREVAIAQALVLGVQNDLDASLRNAYAKTGTMHVLAVSGLHVGLLYGVLLFFLKPLRRGKTSRLLIFLFIVGVVWFYAFVTGLSASVLRSVLMFTLVEFGLLMRKRSSILNTLSLVALGLLLYEPNYLLDVGFQLSFLAVAGIVLLQPIFLNWWAPERKAVKFVWELLAISVAAQLATFPLSLYYFHQFPVYFWAANLVAVPLTSVGLYIGVAFMLLFWVPGLNTWIGKLLEGTLWLLNELLIWLEHWPHAVLDGFVITPGQVVALYLFILTFFLFFLKKKLPWLAGSVLCLAFFAGTELAEAHRLRRKKELVIHSVRKSSATSILQGRQVTFLADSGFYAQPQNFAYQVQPLWWARDVREEVRFGPDFQKTGQKQQVPVHVSPPGNRLVVWQGKRLLWLNKLPKALAQPVNVEAVVLQHNVWAPVEKLAAVMTTRVVVLDQTNSRNYVQRRRQELTEAGYRVHVLEQDGAWTIRLP
ncbi:ComEC/Rec2 family competence protein [Rufibacter ruber]|uniref:ComEC/Rec2 family competence protein n=1 Tax=Rufibacter ruber TaxID=1783499 RepID=UPI0009EE699D|nr:ComEC/Rec2 family competence protein [Rufibacter ruber]